MDLPDGSAERSSNGGRKLSQAAADAEEVDSRINRLDVKLEIVKRDLKDLHSKFDRLLSRLEQTRPVVSAVPKTERI